MQRQAFRTAYFSNKQLLLFAFEIHYVTSDNKLLTKMRVDQYTI